MLLPSLKYSDVILNGVKFYVLLDNKEIYGPLKILSQFRNSSDGINGNCVLTTTKGNYSLKYRSFTYAKHCQTSV